LWIVGRCDVAAVASLSFFPLRDAIAREFVERDLAAFAMEVARMF
jgi:hypothetical protein